MINNIYEKVPFLQILLPLSAGILLSESVARESVFPLVTACLFLLAPLFAGLWGIWSGNAVPSMVRHFMLVGIFCCTGFVQMERSRSQVVFPPPQEKNRHGGRLRGELAVLSSPFQKNSTYRCDAVVLQASDERWKGRKLRVYLKADTADMEADSTVCSLSAGSLLLVECLPRPFENFAEDFDYVSHMQRHGYTASVFLRKREWLEVSVSDTVTCLPPLMKLRCRSAQVRSHLISRYAQWGIEGADLALASALSLGMKDLMDEESRQRFASAGVAHLLAVSGMHVGIVCTFVNGMVRLLLFLLLLPLRGVLRLSGRQWYPPKRFADVLRSLCVMFLLWGYACLTGLSASVIRAVLMFSFSALAICFRRRNRVWNTWAATAVVMLWCRPMLLMDVGFQMSFLSVASILLLMPLFQKMLGWERSGGFETFVGEMPQMPLRGGKVADFSGRLFRSGWKAAGNYMLSSLLLSLSAQLGTAPLSVYYFHCFPRWFFLSNIVLVPMAVGLTYLAMVFQLTAAVPLFPGAVVRGAACVLDGGLSLFSRVAAAANALPGAVQEGLAPSLWEMIPTYCGLILLFFIMQNKSYLYTLENLLRSIVRRRYGK